MEYVNCWNCYPLKPGRCGICQGTGETLLRGLFGSDATSWATCYGCNGSGICTTCGGTGKKEWGSF